MGRPSPLIPPPAGQTDNGCPMSETIHISDLREPVLGEAQRGALAFGEAAGVELSRESILAEARRETGLDDFGSGDFLQRLDLLVEEWDGDAGLSGLGRLTLRNKLVRHCANRLLIRDLLKRHPEIHDIEIKAPIIVAGLPRSGTTHLLNLMAADARLRSLPLWESYEPVPRPGEPATGDSSDPRYLRCAEAWDSMRQFTPLLAAMHPMTPEHIHEELELMGPDIASYNYEWLSPSPRWRDHYYASDQSPHYEYMKTALKILLWQQPASAPARWVLKCPQHLEQLPVLLQTFPDASFAVTHRDPVAVIQSTVTMLAYGQRMNRKRVEADALIEYWSDRIERLLRRCAADRACLPAERAVDVLFHEFMADEMAVVEKIYAGAGLELTAAARARLQAYLAAHPRGKEGRVAYNLRGDFGVEPAQLRRRFEFYFEKFPVKVEE